MIISIENSSLQNKRFRVTMDNGKTYDFGYPAAETFIDHHDKKRREAYFKRHLGNKTEKNLVDNLVASPALLSAYLLWNTTDLAKNIEILNDAWKKKHG